MMRCLAVVCAVVVAAVAVGEDLTITLPRAPGPGERIVIDVPGPRTDTPAGDTAAVTSVVWTGETERVINEGRRAARAVGYAGHGLAGWWAKSEEDRRETNPGAGWNRGGASEDPQLAQYDGIAFWTRVDAPATAEVPVTGYAVELRSWDAGEKLTIPDVTAYLPAPLGAGWQRAVIPFREMRRVVEGGTSMTSADHLILAPVGDVFPAVGERTARVYVDEIAFVRLAAGPEDTAALGIAVPEVSGAVQYARVVDRETMTLYVDGFPAIRSALDQLTEGAWSAHEAALAADPADWKAANAMRDAWSEKIVSAREASGEQALQTPAAYAVDGTAAIAVSATPEPVDVAPAGWPEPRWVWKCIVRLGTPIAEGTETTLHVMAPGFEGTARLAWDVSSSVSPAIHVAAGYGPDGGRFDVGLFLEDLGAWTPPSLAFSLRKGTDYRGELRPVEGPTTAPRGVPWHGEQLYEGTIPAGLAPGVYWIELAGVGRSPSFRVGPDGLDEAHGYALWGLKQQRCGYAQTDGWARPACHHQGVQGELVQSDHVSMPLGRGDPVEAFDASAWALEPEHRYVILDGREGGRHDAADFDLRGDLHGSTEASLLYLARMVAPGPHRARLLEEAEWGLRVYRRLSEHYGGGVPGRIETAGHQGIDAPVAYAASVPTRWTTYAFAALFALYSELSEEQAGMYRAAAIRAFAWASDPAHGPKAGDEIRYLENRGKGPSGVHVLTAEELAAGAPLAAGMEFHARVRLHALTGEAMYLEGLEELLERCPQPDAYGAKHGLWFWYYDALRPGSDLLPDSVRADLWYRWYEREAEWLADWTSAHPYRIAKRTDKATAWDFGWGSMFNEARVLCLVHAATGRDVFLEAARRNVEYMLGRNPLGMAWISGCGWRYPVHFQDGLSREDGIVEARPGLVPYGIGQSEPSILARNIYVADTVRPPPSPRLRAWWPVPLGATRTNEFTHQETMAGAVFATGYLAGAVGHAWVDTGVEMRAPRQAMRLDGRWRQ